MIYNFQHGDTVFTVNIERQPDGTIVAAVGDSTYHLNATPLQDDTMLLDWNNGRVRVHTARHNSERYAYVRGHTLTFSLPDTRGARRRAAVAGGDLTAQMPGQVIDVLVKAGDHVERGQTLVILEAMKMEIRVTAPSDGTIERVSVQTGDVVDRGQVLIEISALS